MTELACSCGAPIPPKTPGRPGSQARWCSRTCWQLDADTRRRTRRDAALAHRTCPICDAPVSLDLPAHAMYCSDACKVRSRRKPTEAVTCSCGVEFMTSRRDARNCSDACARRAYRDNMARICTAGCSRPVRAKGLCGPCYNKARREAGFDIQAWNDRRRDNYHRRRALKARTTTGRPVILADIRERDINRCHLCGDRVSAKPYPHPLSASLDHVVPLSRGGIHDPDNVRLAHLRCNVEKGADGGNEQLLLIG